MALSIGELVGYVTLNTAGVKAGAAVTRAEMAATGRAMDATTGKASKGFGGIGAAIKGVGLTMGALGIAKGIKDSVGLEASFSRTMATIAASTGAPQSELSKLNALAMKLGADTSFSASDAADAMLELAKAGITTSDIMGGALSGTLTLAAAGSTDLGTASTIASNAMNTFGLKGKDMASIAAALAGGANASSASVESLGQALQQVGPGATNAGMSLQETVGILSAFDAAGIKGSDAGTSLKTMLMNLQPQTKRAATAMAEFGLFSKKTGSAFVKSNGEFKSATQIAGLLHDKLGGLSEAQRQTALTSIFGSDASRAATVLMKEGATGIRGYIKATKDQDAAQKMAKANMSGTAGALERMKGSIETAGLAFGKMLAPATVLVAGAIGGLAAGLAKSAGFLSDHKGAAIALVVVLGALTAVTMAHSAAMAVSASGGMAKWLLQTKLISAASKVWTAVQWALNAAMSANPIALVVLALAALGVGLVVAYKKSETFRQIVDGAFRGIATAATFMWDRVIKPVFKAWLNLWFTVIGAVLDGAAKAFGWVPGIGGKLKAAADSFDHFRDRVNAALDGIKSQKDIHLNVSTSQSVALSSINKPRVPHMATGGRVTSPTVALIGEGREPESVLPDSVLRGLLERAHAAGAAGGGRGDTWNITAPGSDPAVVAEQLWFLTRTRG